MNVQKYHVSKISSKIINLAELGYFQKGVLYFIFVNKGEINIVNKFYLPVKFSTCLTIGSFLFDLVLAFYARLIFEKSTEGEKCLLVILSNVHFYRRFVSWSKVTCETMVFILHSAYWSVVFRWDKIFDYFFG